MKSIRARHQQDHISQLLAVHKPLHDYNLRNYHQLRKLQTDVQRQRQADSQPPKAPFKLSRFRSVGAMVLREKEGRGGSGKQGRPVQRTPEMQSVRKQEVVSVLPPVEVAPAPVIDVVKTEATPISPSLPSPGNKLAAETIRNRRNEEEMKCPAGMRILTKEEQTAAYARLAEEQKQTIIALNKVPLASTTPSIVKRRVEYEKRLVDLEKAMAVYERTKVYVHI